MFSLPERENPHPFLLVNPRNCKELYKREWQLAILDCGVGIFHKQSDYPQAFLRKYIELAQKLTRDLGNRMWSTCPDYPSDLLLVDSNAIEKTLENVQNIACTVDSVNWLVSIQGKLHDKPSFLYSMKEILEIERNYSICFDRLGIGTVCNSKNKEFILWCCKEAQKHFPNRWIHAFGLTLGCLREARYYLDSFDSIAWTFPRTPGGMLQDEAGTNRVFQPICRDS